MAVVIVSRGHLIVLLSVLLIPGMVEGGVPQSSVFDTTYVTIQNTLRGRYDLTVHCKSRDDDLGKHLLRYGDSYQFHFRPNIWGSTRFFCSFAWTDKSYYYDIYVQSRDQRRCRVCMWDIKEEGPCMLNPKTGTYNLCDFWNPPSRL